jgi:alginate O-acetyltransferase complex protein AlgI
MLTMLLVGLWHGASWTFVLWGGYNGVLLIVHHALARPWALLPLALQRGATFLLFVVGLALFRSDSLAMAAGLLGTLFSWQPGVLPVGAPLLLVVGALAAAAAHLLPNTFAIEHRWRPAQAMGLAVAFSLCLFVLYGTASTPFLYFQF